jgi:hypothetical protein
VSGGRLNPISIKKAGNVVNSKKYEAKFDINEIQKAIGNCGEVSLRITAKIYDWKLLGMLETCEDCAVGEENRKTMINSG